MGQSSALVLSFSKCAVTNLTEENPRKVLVPRGEKPFWKNRQKVVRKFPSNESVRDPSCDYWHPPVVSKLQVWCNFRHCEAEEKPSKKSKKGGAKGSVALLMESLQLGCVSQDFHPRKSVLREENWDQITPSKSSKGTRHHSKIRETKKIHRKEFCKKARTSRTQYVRSQILGKNTRRNRATRKVPPQSSMGLGEKCARAQKYGQSYVAWVMPAPSPEKPEEREFTVDSARIPTTQVTANGEVQTSVAAQI